MAYKNIIVNNLIKQANISMLDYDPYEVYNAHKRKLIASIAKPTFSHDNARAYADKNYRNKNRRNLLVGGIGGALAGGLGMPTLAGLTFGTGPGPFMRALGPTYGITGGLAGLGLGYLNSVINRKAYRDEGWSEGDELDRKAFSAAQKKYQEDVAKALKEFNLKYTGTEHPSKWAIHRGGIKLYNEGQQGK